ncbi:uncharacterized protein FTOL_06871 [Fusarium torulosum]|uniref:Uncharacterized protein n=1 Tax=Fusarium torulosum TaxID=33205 RepID=A0AAE8MAA6_9HYPO|nr:uncharacterized protein FTOL_06871 [Fusarium torulosum]
MSQPDPFDQISQDPCHCLASSTLLNERRRNGRTTMTLLACQSRMALLEAMVDEKEAQNNQLRMENQRLILTLRHLVPWACVETPATEERDVPPSAPRRRTNRGGSSSDTESEPL